MVRRTQWPRFELEAQPGLADAGRAHELDDGGSRRNRQISAQMMDFKSATTSPSGRPVR
jgi:hypothetical protein